MASLLVSSQALDRMDMVTLLSAILKKNNLSFSVHSSKILTTQQGITREVSSIGKPCRPEHGFPRPNCPGNALIF